MSRNLPYTKVIQGYPDIDDPRLLKEFENFAVGCRVDGGQFQVRVSRGGDFELTCSVLEVGGEDERGTEV